LIVHQQIRIQIRFLWIFMDKMRLRRKRISAGSVASLIVFHSQEIASSNWRLQSNNQVYPKMRHLGKRV